VRIAATAPGQPENGTSVRSDLELAAALTAGDASALEEIYDRFQRAVYGVAHRVTTDPTHAEDVVQEVFVALWQRPGAYDARRGSLGTWLTSTAHHKAVDLVRREQSLRRRRDQVAVQVEQDLRDDQLSEPVDQAAGERWQAERVRRALADLPEVQRQALVLAYFGGYTQREVAAVTGVPLGTVKTRTLAAMRRLREVLAPLVGEETGSASHGWEGGAS
jgi:RNA polymerase sigma factor (sigma-70 family)